MKKCLTCKDATGKLTLVKLAGEVEHAAHTMEKYPWGFDVQMCLTIGCGWRGASATLHAKETGYTHRLFESFTAIMDYEDIGVQSVYDTLVAEYKTLKAAKGSVL